MIVGLYCNYGTLSSEYTPVYSYGVDGVSDRVAVDIPDKYHPTESQIGTYFVTLSLMGEPCEVDLLTALNKFPFFADACTITRL